jgi:hypothetical protein
MAHEDKEKPIRIGMAHEGNAEERKKELLDLVNRGKEAREISQGLEQQFYAGQIQQQFGGGLTPQAALEGAKHMQADIGRGVDPRVALAQAIQELQGMIRDQLGVMADMNGAIGGMHGMIGGARQQMGMMRGQMNRGRVQRPWNMPAFRAR